MLREALGRTEDVFSGWIKVAAADLAVELGVDADAEGLIPGLERLLDDPIACPAGVRALLDLDPAGSALPQRREQFAEKLVAAITRSRVTPAMDHALDALGELGAPLPQSALDRLRGLLDQDVRITAGLQEQEIVPEDERLRMRIKALLEP